LGRRRRGTHEWGFHFGRKCETNCKMERGEQLRKYGQLLKPTFNDLKDLRGGGGGGDGFC